MIISLLKIKKQEIISICNNLLVGSKLNRLYIVVLICMFLMVGFFLTLLYPTLFVDLFNKLNVKIFTVQLNLLTISSLLVLMGGNKNITYNSKNDFLSFYTSRYLFIFIYLKEKILILSLILLIQLFVTISYLLSFISLSSLFVSLFLVTLSFVFNLVFLHLYMNYPLDYFLDRMNNIMLCVIFSVLLFFNMTNTFNLGSIPSYLLLNIPLFYLCTSLLFYAELIAINPNYKKMFFIYRFYKAPYILIFNKHSLLRNNGYTYLILSLISMVFMFFKMNLLSHMYIYIFNLLSAYIILLLFTIMIVLYESYNNKKNYLNYFVFMEVLLIFVGINFYLYR